MPPRVAYWSCWVARLCNALRRKAQEKAKTRQAFHGSPHDFDEFSAARVGTGEGAQAYGHGMYFTSEEDIAKFYRDELTKRDGRIGDRDLLDVYYEVYDLANATPVGPEADALYQKAAFLEDVGFVGIDDALTRIDDVATERWAREEIAPRFQPAGRIYEVKIPDETNMLDWDKPMGEQSESVRAALGEFNLDPNMRGGEAYYSLIARDTPVSEAPALASKALNDAGIPGITYRGRSSGERNFVVFDDALVETVAKYGLGTAAVGATLMSVEDAEAKILSKILEGLGSRAKYLTPVEVAKLKTHTLEKFLEIRKSLPSANEMSAIAQAGKAKKGWYKESMGAIRQVFGEDAPRFTALLASMSPQTSVEMNLMNALNTWSNWVGAGRPTARNEILDVMGMSVAGEKGVDSVLDAWRNNSVRALSTPDAAQIRLSGPKVDSFMHNLNGVMNEVTNDAWMANYAGVDQRIFGGSMTKTDPGKGPGYLAMSAKVREAAERLSKITGEDWTPAEVQETIWSWSKAVFEKPGRPIDNLLEVTDIDIAVTPDFKTLLTDEQYATPLREAGYGRRIDELPGDATVPETRFTEEAYEANPAQLEKAARRLDALKTGRNAAVIGAAGVPLLASRESSAFDIPTLDNLALTNFAARRQAKPLWDGISEEIERLLTPFTQPAEQLAGFATRMVADMAGGGLAGMRGIRGYGWENEDPLVIEADRRHYRETGPRAVPMLTAEGAEADNPYYKLFSDAVGGGLEWLVEETPIPHFWRLGSEPLVEAYEELPPRGQGLLGSAGELGLALSDPFF